MRRPLSLSICVAAVLVGSVSQADPSTSNQDEATRVLAKAVQLMDSGRSAEARVELEKVIQLVPDKPNPYRLLGIVDFRLGRCQEAIGELEAFLGKVGSDDRRVPEVTSIRDKCKADLAPKLGTLIVDSTPHGAKVRLDDEHSEPVGTTPYTNNALPVGPHVVFVEHDGFRSSSRGFTLQKSEKLRLEFGLQKESDAVVSVKVLPAGKPVYRRGWFWGVVGGVVVAAGVGVGLGVYYGTRLTPFNNTLPAFQLGLTQ